ncbi:MAG: UDP-N-acetylglucosamine 1-carboxyvinyltransferase [Lachnospiraceae bacterium]|nr:UDP-N-acetylglucosamine 1-carboxyvinyltransferase [Lachnospiraceae bacterium]
MEQQYVIRGGKPLCGEVFVNGSKNAALGILAAAVMADENVTIDNIPDVQDINTLLDVIAKTGAMVKRIDRHKVMINGSTINNVEVKYNEMREIRGSYYLLGALLGKYRHSVVTLPGGCNIGSRPIDQHIKGFRALGAEVWIEGGNVIADAPKLVGSHIYLDMVSVGATINIMLAAALAEGKTVIENAAKEPHITDCANFLNAMGANIKGAGTDVIRIKGVSKLHGAEYSVIPDQIETGTFMMAAAVTRGDILIRNVIPKHLDSVSSKLREIGCDVYEYDDSIRVKCKNRTTHTHIKTLPYPGFPTDMQPQMAVALALSQGTSIVTESIFDNRFKYVDELVKMGAQIKVESNVAIIDGVMGLTGATLNALDLRAGAALVLAALTARGTTYLEKVCFVKRGYEDFDAKLRSLGAQIYLATNERELEKYSMIVLGDDRDKFRPEPERIMSQSKED